MVVFFAKNLIIHNFNFTIKSRLKIANAIRLKRFKRMGEIQIYKRKWKLKINVNTFFKIFFCDEFVCFFCKHTHKFFKILFFKSESCCLFVAPNINKKRLFLTQKIGDMK